MKKQLMVGLCGFLCAMSAVAKTGVYAEGDVGWVHQSGLPSTVGSATKGHQQPIGVRASVGYNWDFDAQPWGLGAEVAWGSYGRTQYNVGAGKLHSTTYEFLVVGTYHVTATWDGFIKLGGAQQHMEIPTALSSTLGSDRQAVEPMAAIGAGYTFGENANYQVNVTYSHYFGQRVESTNDDAQTPDLDSVMLGFRYQF